MTTTIQIMPFTSLGTRMVQISFSSGSQISTGVWLKESRFLAMLETCQKHRETHPDQTFTFDITDDGERAE